jgi:hypothetical protein
MNKKLLWAAFGGAVLVSLLFGQQVINGYRDYVLSAAPGNPASGRIRIYQDSATLRSGCKDTNGKGCYAANVVNDNVTSVNNAASPYTVVIADGYINCDATGGAVTLTLPAATGSGREISFKKIDSSANACTPTLAGSDTIEGQTTYSLTSQGTSSKIVDALANTVVSGTYTSGGSITGSTSQTCTLTALNGGGANATATVALTGTNAIAGGTAIVITDYGSGYGSAPTSATLGNGTATCSGTAVISTTTAGMWQRSHVNQLGGDVTGPSTANTVKSLNGVLLSGLVTGLLKITTGTGAPSIATAADIPAAATVFGSGTITIPAGNSVIVGCTSTCSVPVPVPAAGYQICIKNDAGITTVITLSALGSSAMYPKADDSGYGTAGTGTMVGSAATNKVCLVGRDATHYELGAINAAANWTVN